ncbi:hypothetical protein CAOG_06129 [Capsaspora owczarzaki ATCC 30864]|uniref:Uncharacterized protein n=1 Tax=Capsaspora owczarzaki (strain ATCC 30864) TaxID=595528 RepID=A0A0D2X4A2_CAPO3|nr:hypothetical protein CAOG_06129 [Capsaspora owczarzaki ATCC 30864]KJE95704.1 hypothetical protein CAOG_006129 [Capsaspora owczarzaki ATCC 30864]|eukprot:XP_004345719.1 hypothetical protein CAOG_06129 [Capsaspora owczarzaki ATCC 30864]
MPRLELLFQRRSILLSVCLACILLSLLALLPYGGEETSHHPYIRARLGRHALSHGDPRIGSEKSGLDAKQSPIEARVLHNKNGVVQSFNAPNITTDVTSASTWSSSPFACDDYFARNNVLLVLHFNQALPQHYDHDKYFRGAFRDVVLSIPEASSDPQSNQFVCPDGYAGRYTYYCLSSIMLRHPGYRGYLFVHFDVFLKFWQLRDMPLDTIWTSQLYQHHNNSDWVHWGRPWGMKALNKMYERASGDCSSRAHRSETCQLIDVWTNKGGLANFRFGGFSDVAYIPSEHVRNFVWFSSYAHLARLFAEITFPLFASLSQESFKLLHPELPDGAATTHSVLKGANNLTPNVAELATWFYAVCTSDSVHFCHRTDFRVPSLAAFYDSAMSACSASRFPSTLDLDVDYMSDLRAQQSSGIRLAAYGLLLVCSLILGAGLVRFVARTIAAAQKDRNTKPSAASSGHCSAI